jgi:hypothetical protein
MHGLPLAVGRWLRIPESGGATIEKWGNWDLVEGQYAESTDGQEFRIELRSPGWYLITVQAETLREDTEIELIEPTAECINALGRWKKAQFVQVDSITASGTATADPSYTTLTRNWHPSWDAAISWMVKTTTANQRVRMRVANGTTATNQRRELIVWRLAGIEGDHAAPANVFSSPVGYSAGSIAGTLLTPSSDAYLEPRPQQYRLTCSAVDAANRWIWPTSTSLYDSNAMHHDFTHELRLKIKTTAPSTATGDVTLRVRAATAGVIHTATVTYGPTETETVVSFARRSSGDHITQVELADIIPADEIDVEAVLNVTE